MQRAVFVIGAGRSGTSAIARGVQALGVELGRDFKRASRKNPTGFFEDRALLDLSKRVRRALGVRADSVGPIDPPLWQRADVRALQQEAIALIRQRFAGAPVWGFKYGRTLRILPFWEPVFAGVPSDPAFVFALRDPLSVARSRARLDPRRGAQETSDREWLAGIVPYLARLRGRPLVVVDYERLMQDPAAQLRRVAAALGLPVDARVEAAIEDYRRAFLDPALRRHRFDPQELDRDPRLHPLARKVYLWLSRLGADQTRWEAPAIWDEWQIIEAEFAALAPSLALIDRQEADTRRAALNPLAFIPGLWRRWRAHRSS